MSFESNDDNLLFNQNEMPFLESLLNEKRNKIISYHMPGHKGRKIPDPLLYEYYDGNLFKSDLVEMNPNIDYLHSPKGSLLKSEKLASIAYGSDETFFLINGSTVGNIAAIMTIASPNKKLLIQRSSHRSVYSGIVLSGVIPIYIEEDYHQDISYPLSININSIENILNKHNDIIGIHLTSPNYYGIVSDIESICNLSHKYNIPIIVDEAHGSHFIFNDKLPKSSVICKCDIIIQSTHKTQGSLTQSAMLHFNNNNKNLVNLSRLKQNLSLLQSSSPSSILLASLDETRMFMITKGKQLLTNIIQLSNEARYLIQNINGLWCYGDELINNNSIFNYDPTKLIVRVSDCGLTGFKAKILLRNLYNIEIEFADLKHIIFSLTIFDDQLIINKLIDSLKDLIKQKYQFYKSDDFYIKPPSSLPYSSIHLRDAYFQNNISTIPINQAIGQISAENIIPYPPGIPLILPGEILEQHHIDYIHYLIEKGSNILGIQDLSFKTINIINQ